VAELPFFPMATDAYLADCGHLSDAEHGRYLLLLLALWRAPNQRLPNDDEWLARRFSRSLADIISHMRPIISEFCQNDGNWITQKRLAAEWKHARGVVEQRREAAKARWNKNKTPYERNTGSHTSRNAPTPTPTPTVVIEPPPSGEGERPSRKGQANGKSGTRIPDGWRPDAVGRSYASDRGLDPDSTADAFTDWWSAANGPSAIKRDWAAAFRTWCRRDADRTVGKPATRGAFAPRGNDAFYEQLAIIASRDDKPG
jgi:uncharacterized protein YdaU (DUF1376 family)